MLEKDASALSEFADMGNQLLSIFIAEGFLPVGSTTKDLFALLISEAARQEPDLDIGISYLVVFTHAFYQSNGYRPFKSKCIGLDIVVSDAIGRWRYAREVLARKTSRF